MFNPDRSSGSKLRLSDRLASVQRRHFVGRASELELFRSALAASDPPFAVLYLYGPGGIGKTTLLGELARIASELHIPVVQMDGRDLSPSPADFLLNLRLMMALEGEASPLDTLAEYPRSVILIDTYETLAALDDWLRDTFLPQLPETCLVVLAGRNPPESAWRTAPGWRDLVRVISLRNLHPDESHLYLGTRGVPEFLRPSVLEFTHGHPLALALVADVAVQRAAAFEPEQEPDVVRVLLEKFVQHVPSPQHREALEICAHTRVTTEALLAATMKTQDAPGYFEWLRGLSFIEQGREGLFPHDLARDVLDTHLRWRNPELYREQHYRIRAWVLERLYNSKGAEQQSSFLDLMYLHRSNPVAKSFYQWKTMGQTYISTALPGDFPLLLEMVRRHEGEESEQIAHYWSQRQPQGFQVFRSFDGELIGFMATLQLEFASTEDRETDPAVRAAMEFVSRQGGLRHGEEIFYCRFFMAKDTYQLASSINNLVTMGTALHWLSRPQLAFSFAATAEPDYWLSFMIYVNQQRSPEADFEVGGRRYGVFTHDWRREPADVWLDIMGERELATEMKPETLEAKETVPLIVLSQPEFEEAVRSALRDYTRPDMLAKNPLLRSRIIAEKADRTAAPKALQQLLQEAASILRSNPRDTRLYRALYHTYFDPAPTQEAAAELLDLPFSTYRYHLTQGIRRLVAWLWQRELYGFQD
jgi:hypothetical protein